MALTIGLLAYLFVDAAHDGLEAAAPVPGSLQGPALFVFGALGGVSRARSRRRLAGAAAERTRERRRGVRRAGSSRC